MNIKKLWMGGALCCALLNTQLVAAENDLAALRALESQAFALFADVFKVVVVAQNMRGDLSSWSKVCDETTGLLTPEGEVALAHAAPWMRALGSQICLLSEKIKMESVDDLAGLEIAEWPLLLRFFVAMQIVDEKKEAALAPLLSALLTSGGADANFVFWQMSLCVASSGAPLQGNFMQSLQAYGVPQKPFNGISPADLARVLSISDEKILSLLEPQNKVEL